MKYGQIKMLIAISIFIHVKTKIMRFNWSLQTVQQNSKDFTGQNDMQ